MGGDYEGLQMLIKGNTRLKGEVEISTSKNAILPIMAASLLSDADLVIRKVPAIRDVAIINKLISELGVKVNYGDGLVSFSGSIKNNNPPDELVRQIRASFLVMGPLLARRGKVKLSLPGGCAIGNRPIDLHLKGLHALGAEISFSSGYVIAEAPQLRGNHLYLDFPSVGATENIMMAAAMAKGVTFIENAALEPEIVDLANFINSMGGEIYGAGTSVIKVKGVKEFHSTDYTPIPDRIEAGSYMVTVAASKGEVWLKNVIPDHIKAITAKLRESGTMIREEKDSLYLKSAEEIEPIYIKTLPYPGFPTDMQAQFMAYLCCANGSSVISETVFENRFMHVPELLRMGADIKTEGRTAIIKGVKKLSGANVKATDLRAGAALITAAISAEGTTVINDCEHISRGYEDIINKLSSLGAQIELKT